MNEGLCIRGVAPKEATMTIFKATVELYLNVENEAEACDGVAEMLREHIRAFAGSQSCLIDWRYPREAMYSIAKATPAEVAELEYQS